MRIYEFSKKIGASNKEILDLLKDQGFDVITHMSKIPDNALDYLNKYYEKSLQAEPLRHQEETRPSKIMQEPDLDLKKEEAIITQQPKQKEPSQPAKSFVEPLPLTSMTVSYFAQKVNKPVTDVMLTLLKQGVVSSKNQLLPEKTIEQLAHHYQYPLSKHTEKPKEDIVATQEEKSALDATHARLPIIVVIGHVDHGKTTLLDFIRKTRVAAREQGGITQHLGAYQVKTAHGGIVFLDTPGHEAFIKMRQRGIKAADIAVLVVAADDGIMPQTVEAIKYAKNLKVPLIVAINKVDKASPLQIESVKRELTQYDLLPEEWGGQTICVPISAKTGAGIDQLLEMIQLQAEVMELRADADVPGKGFVLEARIEKGRGPVATVIAQEGTIKVGDFFSAGSAYGKVNSLVDSASNSLKSVGPSVPVQVAGFDQLPEAGDFFSVISQERYQKMRSSKEVFKEEPKQFVFEDGINLIIKADTKSSKEAIAQSIDKLSQKSSKKFQIVYSGIGDVSESDIELAHTTNSIIYGFHVKFELKASALAQKHGVAVNFFQVIYKLLDAIELMGKESEPKKIVETKIGEAVVRKTFAIKNVGTIAGAYVKEGRLSRNGKVVIWRGRAKIGEGSIKSLERDKKSVKEVHTGFECAFLVEGFNDWNIDDRVECFIDLPSKN